MARLKSKYSLFIQKGIEIFPGTLLIIIGESNVKLTALPYQMVVGNLMIVMSKTQQKIAADVPNLILGFLDGAAFLAAQFLSQLFNKNIDNESSVEEVDSCGCPGRIKIN